MLKNSSNSLHRLAFLWPGQFRYTVTRDCGLMLVQDLGDVKTSLARLLKLVETMATRLEGLRHQFQGVKLYEVRIL